MISSLELDLEWFQPKKTENMISDVQNALTLIQQSVNEPDTFDPKSSKRNFKLSLGDVSEGRVLPFIMKEIYQDSKKYISW